MEENSVGDRDLSKDVSTFKASSEKIRHVVTKIKEMKAAGAKVSSVVSKHGLLCNILVLKQILRSFQKEEVEALRKTGVLEFVVLKRMNRMARFNCKAVRDKTHEVGI